MTIAKQDQQRVTDATTAPRALPDPNRELPAPQVTAMSIVGDRR